MAGTGGHVKLHGRHAKSHIFAKKHVHSCFTNYMAGGQKVAKITWPDTFWAIITIRTKKHVDSNSLLDTFRRGAPGVPPQTGVAPDIIHLKHVPFGEKICT
jgi:hypothetical protein